MKDLTDQIPVELLRAERKAEVMEWIRARGLPRRFKRKLLQDWGAAVGVELTTEDYMKVSDWLPGGTSFAGQRT